MLNQIVSNLNRMSPGQITFFVAVATLILISAVLLELEHRGVLILGGDNEGE